MLLLKNKKKCTKFQFLSPARLHQLFVVNLHDTEHLAVTCWDVANVECAYCKTSMASLLYLLCSSDHTECLELLFGYGRVIWWPVCKYTLLVTWINWLHVSWSFTCNLTSDEQCRVFLYGYSKFISKLTLASSEHLSDCRYLLLTVPHLLLIVPAVYVMSCSYCICAAR